MTENLPFGRSSGITFLGIRTAQIGEMEWFLRDCLGYEQTRRLPGFYTFRTAMGQRVELFEPGYPDKEHFTTGPVPGFEVAELSGATRWLTDHGLEILSDPVVSQTGTSWVHFRGPDGNVYELVNHPDHK